MQVIEIIDFARNILKSPLDAARAFPDDSSSFFSDTILLNFLNREQNVLQNKLIQSFENWFTTSCAININSGQEAYDMPSGCMRIIRMESTEDPENPREIFPMSFNDKEKYSTVLVNGVTSVGQLNHYAIFGGKIYVRPKPKKSTTNGLTFFYVRKLDDLTSGTQVSDIPGEYHELLAWGIVKRGMIMQEANAEAIAIISNEYNRLYAEMAVNAEDRQSQRPRQVKRMKFRVR
jgi:hypothetical protein